MKKLYLVAVNDDSTLDKVVFHNYITSLYPSFINAWWHYLKGSTYFIKTSLSANELYNKIYPGIPGRHLIIVEINANNKQGWLPKAAWDWINNNKP